jgi:hypothetical protein
MKNKKGGKLKTIIAVTAVAAAVCALFTVAVNAVMTGTYEKLTDGLPEGKKPLRRACQRAIIRRSRGACRLRGSAALRPFYLIRVMPA